MQRAKNGLVLVVFTKSWGSYSRGRTAGFPDKEAARLINVIRVAQYKGEERSAAADGVAFDPSGDDEPDPIDGLLKKAADEGKDWRTAHHATLKSVASQITDAPILSKDDAIAAIELEIENRKAGQ